MLPRKRDKVTKLTPVTPKVVGPVTLNGDTASVDIRCEIMDIEYTCHMSSQLQADKQYPIGKSDNIFVRFTRDTSEIEVVFSDFRKIGVELNMRPMYKAFNDGVREFLRVQEVAAQEPRSLDVVHARIDAGHYTHDTPFPDRILQKTDPIKYANQKAEYQKKEIEVATMFNQDFRSAFAEEVGCLDLKTDDDLWAPIQRKVWDDGHVNGYHEIVNIAYDFVEMLAPILARCR